MRRPNDSDSRRSLLKTGRLSDLTLIIPELCRDSAAGADFRIHSSIVASRCPMIWESLNASGRWIKSAENSKHATWTIALPHAVAMDGPWQKDDVALFLEHVYLEASNDTWEAYWSGLPDITADLMLRCWLRQHRLAHFFGYPEMVEAIEFYIGSIMLDRWAKQEHNRQRLNPYIAFLLEACLAVVNERNTLFLRILAWALSILPSLETLTMDKTAVREHWRQFALNQLHIGETDMAGLSHDAACFVICSKCLQNPLIVPDKLSTTAAGDDNTCCSSLTESGNGSFPPLPIKKRGRSRMTTTTTTKEERSIPFALSGSADHLYPTTLVYMNMTPFSKSQTIPVTYEYLDAHHGLLYQQLEFKSNDYFPSISLSFSNNGVSAPRLHYGRCMQCQKTQPVHAIFTRQVADSTIHAA